MLASAELARATLDELSEAFALDKMTASSAARALPVAAKEHRGIQRSVHGTAIPLRPGDTLSAKVRAALSMREASGAESRTTAAAARSHRGKGKMPILLLEQGPDGPGGGDALSDSGGDSDGGEEDDDTMAILNAALAGSASESESSHASVDTAADHRRRRRHHRRTEKVAASPPPPLQPQVAELLAEIDTLKDQVHRLNVSLAQHQVDSGLYPDGTLPPDMGAPQPWLVDGTVVAPLFAHYDKEITLLESRVAFYEQTVQLHKDKTVAVVRENGELFNELRGFVGAVSANQPDGPNAWPAGPSGGGDRDNHGVTNAASTAAATADFDELAEQLSLTEKELDLLMLQHQRVTAEAKDYRRECLEQRAELSRLQSMVEDFSREGQDAQQAMAHLEVTGEKLSQARQQLKARLAGAEEKYDELFQQDQLLQQAVAPLLRGYSFSLDRVTASMEVFTQYDDHRQAQLALVKQLQDKLAANEKAQADTQAHAMSLSDTLQDCILGKDAAVARADKLSEELTSQAERLRELRNDTQTRLNSHTASLVQVHNNRIAELGRSLKLAQAARADAESGRDRLRREAAAQAEEIKASKADYRTRLQQQEVLLQQALSVQLRSEADRHAAEMALVRFQDERADRQLDAERLLQTAKMEVAAEKRKNQVMQNEIIVYKEDLLKLSSAVDAIERGFAVKEKELATSRKAHMGDLHDANTKYKSTEKESRSAAAQIDIMHTKRIEDLQICLERELHVKRELQLQLNKVTADHAESVTGYTAQISWLKGQNATVDDRLRAARAEIKESQATEATLSNAALQATETAEGLKADYDKLSAFLLEKYAAA